MSPVCHSRTFQFDTCCILRCLALATLRIHYINQLRMKAIDYLQLFACQAYLLQYSQTFDLLDRLGVAVASQRWRLGRVSSVPGPQEGTLRLGNRKFG